MQIYIPKMLPEYVEVEPDVFQPYSDATVAGWRNEQRLAAQQGKHQRGAGAAHEADTGDGQEPCPPSPSAGNNTRHDSP